MRDINLQKQLVSRCIGEELYGDADVKEVFKNWFDNAGPDRLLKVTVAYKEIRPVNYDDISMLALSFRSKLPHCNVMNLEFYGNTTDYYASFERYLFDENYDVIFRPLSKDDVVRGLILYILGDEKPFQLLFEATEEEVKVAMLRCVRAIDENAQSRVIARNYDSVFPNPIYQRYFANLTGELLLNKGVLKRLVEDKMSNHKAALRILINDMKGFYNEQVEGFNGKRDALELLRELTEALTANNITREFYNKIGGVFIGYKDAQEQGVPHNFDHFYEALDERQKIVLEARVRAQQDIQQRHQENDQQQLHNIQPSTSYTKLQMILCGAVAVCAIAAAYVFRGSLIEGFSKLAEKLLYSSLADKAKDGYVNR